MKKRADGRYCKQILVGYKPDGTKKTKTIYGKTIKEVEKKERELRKEIDDGVDVCESTTVAEWADIWIKTYKSNVEYNTEKRYKATIDNQIKPTIGFYELRHVTSEIIQNEINKLAQQYSASTIKKYKITLNQMFSSALISGKIKNNPTLGVVIPKIKDEKTDEFKFIPKTISAYIPEFCKTYKNGSLIMTLLYTGMRRGELVALTWNDVSFDDGCIRINKAAEFRGNKANIKCPKTKSGTRVIPLLDILKPFLKKPAKAKNDDYVFTNERGQMHTNQSIRRLTENFNKEFSLFLEEKEKTLFNKITMHKFRHTFATILYEAGIDIKTAQSYLGHSSISVTMDIYTHLDNKFKKINADKLNEFCNVI